VDRVCEAQRNGNGFARRRSHSRPFRAGPSLLTDCAESVTVGGTSELFVGRLLLASCRVQVYVYFLLGTIPLVPNPLLPNAIHWEVFAMRSLALFSLVAASYALAAKLEERAANWTVGQTVQTSSGPVNGHSATNDSDVSEYLGIPFGQAPIGDLRFAAPLAFNGTAPLNGSSFVSLVHSQRWEG
jgi:Carboxylesterase family